MHSPGYPAAAYRQAAIDTAPPGEIIVLLYRRAILACHQGAKCIEEKNFEKAHHNLVRAQQIVFELRRSLNHEAGDVASGLQSIYDYLYQDLTEANVSKDAALARQVGDMMESLLEAWETVMGQREGADDGA